MTVENRVERIRELIDKIRRYNRLLAEDNFESATVDDIKGNVKNLCDEIKAEADQIKDEVDQWT